MIICPKFNHEDEIMAAMMNGPIAYAEIPEDVYRKSHGISQSMLKEMRKSPSKFQWRMDHPRKSSAAQDLGTAIHMAILEPDKFDSTYASMPKFDRRTNKGKADAAEWEIQNKSKVGLDRDTMDIIFRVTDRVTNDAHYSQFFSSGLKEKCFYSYDQSTGLYLKGKLDNVILDKGTIVDLKTTEDASEEMFSRDIAKYYYTMQAAFYYDLYEAATGIKADFYVIVAVEKSEDCDINTYFINKDELAKGRKLYRRWLNELSICVKNNAWPGYARKFIEYKSPEWFNRLSEGETFW